MLNFYNPYFMPILAAILKIIIIIIIRNGAKTISLPNLTLFGRLNKSWKPECVWSFNKGWQRLVFYPEPEA